MDTAVSGKLLLYSDAGTASQFTWFDRRGKRLGEVGEPGEYLYSHLSPDGRRAVITRAKPGGRDLWVLDADRGVANRFTATPGNTGYSVWSPDDRTIVFASGASQHVSQTGCRRRRRGAPDEVI
jgi:Tol biopolymer transport system component